MKKFFALLLVAGLFTFASCGGGGKEGTGTDTTSATDTSGGTTTPDTTNNTPSTDGGETKTDTAAAGDSTTVTDTVSKGDGEKPDSTKGGE
ncbi:MAG TPA: hypothetical protein DCS93_41175 [Microscillaceae bacterium]|nr:hypothetical protein [Microscillaceae bacterium]